MSWTRAIQGTLVECSHVAVRTRPGTHHPRPTTSTSETSISDASLPLCPLSLLSMLLPMLVSPAADAAAAAGAAAPAADAACPSPAAARASFKMASAWRPTRLMCPCPSTTVWVESEMTSRYQSEWLGGTICGGRWQGTRDQARSEGAGCLCAERRCEEPPQAKAWLAHNRARTGPAQHVPCRLSHARVPHGSGLPAGPPPSRCQARGSLPARRARPAGTHAAEAGQGNRRR